MIEDAGPTNQSCKIRKKIGMIFVKNLFDSLFKNFFQITNAIFRERIIRGHFEICIAPCRKETGKNMISIKIKIRFIAEEVHLHFFISASWPI